MAVNIEEQLSGWLAPAIAVNGYPSEWFEKRIATIRGIVSEANIDRTVALLTVFLGVASSSQEEEISKLVQAGDLSYDRSNSFLNRLIAGSCLLEALNERDQNSDAIALSASVYSYQQRAFDSTASQIEAEFYAASRAYLSNELRAVRPPLNVFVKTAEYGKKSASTANIKKTLETITDGSVDKNTATLKALTEITEHMGKVQSEVIDRVNELIDSANTQLDNQHKQITIAREESNLLWWLFGEFSRDENKPFAELGFPTALLHLGKEAADLTEILPGHIATKGILSKALTLLDQRSEKPMPDSVSLSELVGAGGPVWPECKSSPVLPLCHIHRAMKMKMDGGRSDGWKKSFEQKAPFKSTHKFTLLDTAYQVYQECLLIRAVNGVS